MKEYIANRIKPLKIGCYDLKIENLSKAQIDRVLEELDTGDVVVYINRKKHVVEKAVVDDELDLWLVTAEEYRNTYGRAVHT